MNFVNPYELLDLQVSGPQAVTDEMLQARKAKRGAVIAGIGTVVVLILKVLQALLF